MEKNIQTQLLESNELLIKTCSRLSKINTEQTNMIKVLLIKNSSLTKLCATIYSVLSTKINRIWLEENWLISLREHLKTKA
jgi:hypothetical protein